MAIALKALMRRFIGFLFFYGGGFHLFRFIHNIGGKRLTIVTYHRITDRDINTIKSSLPFLFTSKQVFEKQLQFFRRWYKVITFEELENYLKKGGIPWNLIIITFDDGYEDVYLNAYPILKEHNVKAICFIAADKMENRNKAPFWWDRVYFYLNRINTDAETRAIPSNGNEVISLFKTFGSNPSKLFEKLNGLNTELIEKCLDEIAEEYGGDETEIVIKNRTLRWEEIHRMGAGMAIGSHSCNHCNLVEMERDKKIYEIKESAKIIETNCGKRPLVFSYPGGKKDEETEQIVENAGYKFAVTTYAGVDDLKDPLALKRINIWEDTSLTTRGRFSKGYFAFKLIAFKRSA